MGDGWLRGWAYDDAGRVTASTGQLNYEYDKGGLRTEVSGSFARTGIPGFLATDRNDLQVVRIGPWRPIRAIAPGQLPITAGRFGKISTTSIPIPGGTARQECDDISCSDDTMRLCERQSTLKTTSCKLLGRSQRGIGSASGARSPHLRERPCPVH